MFISMQIVHHIVRNEPVRVIDPFDTKQYGPAIEYVDAAGKIVNPATMLKAVIMLEAGTIAPAPPFDTERDDRMIAEYNDYVGDCWPQ